VGSTHKLAATAQYTSPKLGEENLALKNCLEEMKNHNY
jgi:hypothetical protein